ncbi:MAG: hypothetical protein R3213_07830 [Flavobacteriaceae bacterium]|nr:hypothetical protein [Flavobacteriaceae bacterium]
MPGRTPVEELFSDMAEVERVISGKVLRFGGTSDFPTLVLETLGGDETEIYLTPELMDLISTKRVRDLYLMAIYYEDPEIPTLYQTIGG